MFFRTSVFTRSNRFGFTLVELLIALFIVGILVALLIPAIQKSRAIARNIECKSNLKQLVLACHLYAETNNGSWPSMSNQSYTTYWFGTDPQNLNTFGMGFLGPFMEMVGQIQLCPDLGDLPFGSFAEIGYGYNRYLGWSEAKYKSLPIWQLSPETVAKIFEGASWKDIVHSIRTPAFCDSAREFGANPINEYLMQPPFEPLADGQIGNALPPSMHFRHPGNVCHVAWCSGGVGSVTMTYNLTSSTQSNIGFFGQDNQSYSLEAKTDLDLEGVLE